MRRRKQDLKFREFELRRQKQLEIKKLKRKKILNKRPIEVISHEKKIIIAPKDFRLLENKEDCLLFFLKMRNKQFIYTNNNLKFVEFTLKQIEFIDYETLSILKAIEAELKSEKIFLRCDFSKQKECNKLLEESGFLNSMYDKNGRKFPKSSQSELIYFEKGSGHLSLKENQKSSQALKQIVKHLTGEQGHCKYLKTIILEICGNTIEWSNAKDQKWLLGIRFLKNEVIITITDLGDGILSTLNRKFKELFLEAITPESTILMNAFEKKYGSKSEEINRNKGLPCIKQKFKLGQIKSLKVLTNNVFLDFDNKKNSDKLNTQFNGTFYRWTVDLEALNK